MKPIMIELKDMSDSVEVYESRPHPFFVIFIYLILGLLIASGVFMYFFKIDTKVDANGIFRQEEKSCEISSMVSGRVSVCNLEEGKYVTEGEVLVMLDDSHVQDELQNYQKQREKLQEKVNLLEVYLNALDDETDNEFLSEKSIAEGELAEYEMKLLECDSTIQMLQKNLEQYQLTAQQSGYISMTSSLAEGSYVGQGTVVCEIIPEDKGKYYAEIYISNEDIGNIKEGDSVKLELNSYPATEYGYVNGVIENVSKDIKVDSESGSAYYIAKVSCKNIELVSKDGKIGQVKNGMMSHAGIITGKKRVLTYILEMIDLF